MPTAAPVAPVSDDKKPAKAPPKPMVALVLPATKKVLGYEKVKPYVTPDYEAEPPLEPS